MYDRENIKIGGSLNGKKYRSSSRHDPNYIQLSGDVRKELGLQFKAACTLKQLNIGEGLEEAIEIWFQAQQAPSSSNTSKKGDE
ncbi:MAG: hypothetical protein WBA89_01085 [Microcoleus sp.]|uniref:hypothetical protein n=1 Tax=Microcoleus sp. TaxID=44472 RepID=UPI003C766D48